MFCVALLMVLPGIGRGTMVTLESAQDNTLYENGTDNASNGAGDYIFAGRTLVGDIRRGLLRFDVAGNVPPGATIDSATLSLYMSKTRSSTGRSVSIHPATASWGEGTSHATGEEGGGANPSVGDATWFYRFYPTQEWITSGGDFDPEASAATTVGGNGDYSWSSSALVADVQRWRDNPESNFGWVVIGDESSPTTAKRFQSRGIASVSQRPRLMIHYTADPGVDAGACCLPDGSCIILVEADCTSANGIYQGDDTTCSSAPCTGLPLTIQITTARDNTLYEESGGLSNGAGEFFFTGRQSTGIKRRAVIAFDLASEIPQGALVMDATLTLRTTQGGSAANDVKLHRAFANWGEGSSDASGDEWGGAPATPNDATWTHRFYPSQLWTNPGGDYEPMASASAYVAFESFYSWSSAEMVSDLQAWVDDPDSNFGWVMIGQETGMVTTQKRFASRENPTATWRPVLEIIYSVPPPVPTGACCLMDAMCEVRSASDCDAMGGMYLGDGVACTPGSCGLELEPYVDALPLPPVAVPVSGVPGGAATYEISIIETQQRLHRDLPPTTVWGYDGIYPGPTIEARRDQPVTVTWVNDLRDSTGTLRETHYLPVDMCLHGPDTEGATPRTVVHLHGGHVPADSDGYPEDTILPGERQTFVYPNRQLASMLWYHDHALGITRLNVLMGLAGCYFVRDDFEESLGLPSGAYEVPLVIQDRSFRADGSLLYPPAWAEHFFGDKTLVNGKVWPYLEVERGAYRFRVLNGSNSRTYTLSLSNQAPMILIGGDGGLLRAPVAHDSLTLHPGERADVIIDFSGEIAGTEILLRNSAPAPYPEGDPMHALDAVMKFIVRPPAGFAWTVPDSLRPMAELDEGDAVQSRDFTLEKFSDPCTGSIWLINGMHWPHIHERPRLGSTEIWRFINRSGMAHPMHMHLVMFQVLDIQPFTVVNDTVQVTGPPVPPDPSLAGWKDTVPVLPNEMVRVIARFDDYIGKFPYHCHMLEHEDNDMMRQFEVVDTTSAGTGTDSQIATLKLEQSRPNPATHGASITFQIPVGGMTRIEVYDTGGRRVSTLLEESLKPGAHTVWWEGRDDRGRPLAPGVYLYRLTVPERPPESRKLLLLE